MVPILINRDVFEPSYNDLKFRVQNHSYFCTNLIATLNKKKNKTKLIDTENRLVVAKGRLWGVGHMGEKI